MGVAVVIVNHMRTMPTQLHEILPNYTSMPVDLITDNLIIEPNRVFIIPENRDLHVVDGEFRLKPISKPRGWPDVITVFLRSMTRCWDGKLIAVIVSGYDGDGAAALCGIQQVGGITIAQKLSTARQPDMPESAIASGCIDFVLSPEDIAQELLRIAQEEAKVTPTAGAPGARDEVSVISPTRESRRLSSPLLDYGITFTGTGLQPGPVEHGNVATAIADNSARCNFPAASVMVSLRTPSMLATSSCVIDQFASKATDRASATASGTLLLHRWCRIAGGGLTSSA